MYPGEEILPWPILIFKKFSSLEWRNSRTFKCMNDGIAHLILLNTTERAGYFINFIIGVIKNDLLSTFNLFLTLNFLQLILFLAIPYGSIIFH